MSAERQTALDFVEDVECALVEVGLSHKAACIAMELDNATWTRMRQTGRVDAARLTCLGEAFERALVKRRALRMGLKVEEVGQLDPSQQIRAALHTLIDNIEVLPIVRRSA